MNKAIFVNIKSPAALLFKLALILSGKAIHMINDSVTLDEREAAGELLLEILKLHAGGEMS
jgi:hypothetical protein